MELYLNEPSPEVIAKYLDLYPIDGVTLNPKMIATLGAGDYAETLRTLRKTVGNKKLFTQVTSDNYEDILKEARYIVSVAGPDTYVKVPANEVGIKAIGTLHKEGIHTLGTLCFTCIQAVMALQAGADYVAVLYNYMVDAGYDAAKTMRDIAAYVKESRCHGQLMGVGVRNQMQFSDCVGAGCTAINLNADNITEWMLNEPAVSTTKSFMDGWIQTWGDTRIVDFIE